jgi:hypothetical protein
MFAARFGRPGLDGSDVGSTKDVVAKSLVLDVTEVGLVDEVRKEELSSPLAESEFGLAAPFREALVVPTTHGLDTLVKVVVEDITIILPVHGVHEA